MPYVQRDAQGRIVALHREPSALAHEALDPGHAEVKAFLGRTESSDFSRLDADFVRVLEDVIDTLIDRHVLNLTDLPAEAQAKLLARKSFRSRSQRRALSLFGNEPLSGLVGDPGLRDPADPHGRDA